MDRLEVERKLLPPMRPPERPERPATAAPASARERTTASAAHATALRAFQRRSTVDRNAARTSTARSGGAAGASTPAGMRAMVESRGSEVGSRARAIVAEARTARGTIEGRDATLAPTNGEDRDDPEETARRATAARPTAGAKFATVTADMMRVASKRSDPRRGGGHARAGF